MAAPVAIWTLKSSLLSIVVRPLFFLCMFSALVIAALAALNMGGADPSHGRKLLIWAVIVLLARFLVEILIWLATSFTLTRVSIITHRGVLRRSVVEVPLANIQHLEIFRGIRERLIGAGTIGIGTGAGVEAVLDSVSDPHSVLASIRANMNLSPPASPAAIRPPVIGLVGSIGAGKSTLAKMFQDRGCLVLDSDVAAKEALKRPEVISAIIDWWGRDLLDAQGEIDRRRLADLVFNDPAKRKQLEGLTHPLLKIDRAAAIAQCTAVPAVVIDAPLLFEAGVDVECDYVICVDAPRSVRLERAKSRGWSDLELARREAAQLPIEEKRRRSTWVVENSLSRDILAAKADEILKQIVRKNQ